MDNLAAGESVVQSLQIVKSVIETLPVYDAVDSGT